MLPAFDHDLDVAGRLPFGATSEAAVYLARLLVETVPHLATGELRIVAIARRPGVLAKVAVSGALTRIGADHLADVRARVGGVERIEVIAYRREPRLFIAEALGLPEPPPMLLVPVLKHAHVLLGEIDLRGRDGWRGVNRVLASAVTGWRIRLQPVAASPAWRSLSAAQRERRAVVATVLGPMARGALRVEVHGLYAVLPRHAQTTPCEVGQEVDVRVLRLDPDEGRITVTQRLTLNGQLRLLSA